MAALEAAKAAAVAVEDFVGAAAIKEQIAGLQRTKAGAGAPAPSAGATVADLGQLPSAGKSGAAPSKAAPAAKVPPGAAFAASKACAPVAKAAPPVAGAPTGSAPKRNPFARIVKKPAAETY